MNNEKQVEYLLVWQRPPPYPSWQLQRYPLTWSTHVPLFKQGLLEHSSISTWNGRFDVSFSRLHCICDYKRELNINAVCDRHRCPCYWGKSNKVLYYISWLVRALWLVNLAGRTLLYGPLKFKVYSVANCLVIYRQLFLTFIASKNLKLFLL